jgi:hypothetical protein
MISRERELVKTKRRLYRLYLEKVRLGVLSMTSNPLSEVHLKRTKKASETFRNSLDIELNKAIEAAFKNALSFTLREATGDNDTKLNKALKKADEAKVLATKRSKKKEQNAKPEIRSKISLGNLIKRGVTRSD